MHVLVVLFPAIICRRFVRTRNDGPTQRAGQLDFKSSCLTAGAMHRVNTGIVHNQPQRYTTATSRASPTFCLCDSHGDYVCVVCVCTECTAVLMYDMRGLGVGSMLLAARLLVYTQLDRASRMQQTDLSVNYLSSLASFVISTSISTGMSIATAPYCVHTSTSTYHKYEYSYDSYVQYNLFASTSVFICLRYPSLLSLLSIPVYIPVLYITVVRLSSYTGTLATIYYVTMVYLSLIHI